MRVAVVGGGVVGLATAKALTERGARVVLIDERPLLNAHNASNDESKVFRLAYAGDREGVARAKRALDGWREIERESGRAILHETGLLLFPGAFARDSRATLRAMGEACEDVAGEPWPAVRGAAGGTLDPRGGWLDPAAALRALHATAGAETIRGARVERIEADGRVRLSGGGAVAADAVVVAAGFHAPALLPELRGRIVVTRQVELFFDAPDGIGSFPVFADLDGGFYGFPPRGRAVKVADHRKGPVVTDFDARPPPTREEVGAARAWLAAHIPALADARLARWRVCLYDNAPDDRFILGPSRDLPRVVVAAGMSGHAFKFAPALGEELAEMVGNL